MKTWRYWTSKVGSDNKGSYMKNNEWIKEIIEGLDLKLKGW